MANNVLEQLKNKIQKFEAKAKVETVGNVLSVGDGIARISGLSSVKASEMLEFPGGTLGVALNLEEDSIGAILLGSYEHIKQGDT
jgi:F-type H+-transporting ATPase subunit alpha